MRKSISIEVTGDQQLFCEGCERRVERMLKGLPGVDQVRAQARNQRIDVLFDDAIQTPAALADRLQSAGYLTRVAGTPTLTEGSYESG